MVKLVTELLNFETKFDGFNGASILVTGGTGSFGQQFVRRILSSYSPKRLIVYSRDELKQFEMQQEFPGVESSPMRYFIGDVRDLSRLELAMSGVDYVVHAAAMKHVTAAEYNPFECVKTNIIGAQNVVMAAIRSGVKKVIALSTDKAAGPVNLYGATKLVSDKIFICSNSLTTRGECKFSVVRYGNVLNSRGSVVPLFLEKIRSGAEYLPITDERMTRFLITLDQGVDLICKAFSLTKGGEILVPKIPSMRIVDLAAALAPDLKHHVVGVRPGEKIHEILIPSDESRRVVDMGSCYVIMPEIPYTTYHPISDIIGTSVPSDFEYNSFSNEWYLSIVELRNLVKELIPSFSI